MYVCKSLQVLMRSKIWIKRTCFWPLVCVCVCLCLCCDMYVCKSLQVLMRSKIWMKRTCLWLLVCVCVDIYSAARRDGQTDRQDEEIRSRMYDTSSLIHTYIYIYIYIHTHTHIHTCTCACACVCMYVHIHTYIHIYTHIEQAHPDAIDRQDEEIRSRMYDTSLPSAEKNNDSDLITQAPTYIHIYIHIYTYTYIHTYIHIYTHRTTPSRRDRQRRRRNPLTHVRHKLALS
jgi:hypothetical protein